MDLTTGTSTSRATVELTFSEELRDICIFCFDEAASVDGGLLLFKSLCALICCTKCTDETCPAGALLSSPASASRMALTIRCIKENVPYQTSSTQETFIISCKYNFIIHTLHCSASTSCICKAEKILTMAPTPKQALASW